MTAAFYDAWDKPEPVTEGNSGPVTHSHADGGDFTGYLNKVCDGVTHAVNGTRNHTLNGAAYTLGRIVEAGQLDEATVTDALEVSARAVGLDEAEIGPTIASGLTAGRRSPRALEPGIVVPEVTTIEVEPDETPGQAIRRLFPILDWEALWDDDSEEEWIVEPILPVRRLVALYSAPKVGKSLLMLELAVAVATGREVLGRTPDRPRRVLYVDFENDPRADVRERLQAMGCKPADLENLAYLSFPTLAALDSERGGLELMAVIGEYACEVVMIDTVSRAVKGEENENDTWLDFYRHTGLKLKQSEISLIRLDHSGKDETKGQRGGSAKVGDVDAVWRLSRVSDDVFSLDCEANRMPIHEKRLVVTRHTEPLLRHTVATNAVRTAGEAAVAQADEVLTQLGAEGRIKERDALDLVKGHVPHITRAAVRGALKLRQQRLGITILEAE